MILSVLRANNGACPRWNVPVCVRGTCREDTDGNWQFLRAECPIIQNEKLPVSEQEPRYKLMRCHWWADCPLMKFQPSITSDR